MNNIVRRKLDQLKAKGYLPHKARIRHIIYWRYEEIEEGATKRIEIPIVLPEILFRKQETI
jgi:hypothetical protein